MKKYMILVEGTADLAFISDYLCHIFDDLLPDDNLDNKKVNHRKKIKQKSKNKERVFIHKIPDTTSTDSTSTDIASTSYTITAKIHVYAVGGCSAIEKHLQTKLEEYNDDNFEILVIQDADSEDKDAKIGGKELRIKYLENIKTEMNITFSTFLFPDNERDGDLENLLLEIVKNDKYDKAMACYRQYAECTREFGLEKSCDEMLENKSLVFEYLRIYEGMSNAKEQNRKYTDDFWDLANENLKPLSKFLQTNIHINSTNPRE